MAKLPLRAVVQAIIPNTDKVSANQVTLASLVLLLASLPFFCLREYVIGGLLFTVSWICDFVDGEMARLQQERLGPARTLADEASLTLWQKICLRGQSHFGASFDALVDKIRHVSALFVLGYNYVFWPFLGLTALLALLLTLKRLIWPSDAKSRHWGKAKTWYEVLGVVCVVMLPRDWGWSYWITHGVIALAIILATLSLWSHVASRTKDS